MLYKIDNSKSNAKVKYVSVKLLRVLKFRSHGEMAQSIGEPNHKFLIFNGRYEGIDNNKKNETFSKRILIDLREIFCLK